MHTFLILIWPNLRHMRRRGIWSTIRKNTKFLPPQTVWFDSTRRVSVCSCRVEGIEWFGVIHLCRKFHVIWIFRALLPYQRCWGEALWPWSHAEASMVWKWWLLSSIPIFSIFFVSMLNFRGATQRLRFLVLEKTGRWCSSLAASPSPSPYGRFWMPRHRSRRRVWPIELLGIGRVGP